ncbi:MAG: helix-turn-helix domain-containing protein [Selenomonadaceae bacterium]|nr:helix-turn-helix domain-containing protein [Selenomonadaceae bacterium]
MEEYEKKGYLLQDFRVFRLRDAVMKEIPFHYHDFHKIILFLQGQGDYIIEGKSYPLKPRDIIFVSAGEIHRPIISPDFPYERIVIYMSPEFLKTYAREGEELTACFRQAHAGSSVMHVMPGKSHDLLYHMEKLEKSTHIPGFAKQLYTELLFIEFMILLNRALLEHEIEELHDAEYRPKIQELLQFINEHLFEELSIDELACHAYMSKHYMMRRFKAETGCSIHQYITNKRLLHARSLLSGELPVTQICYDCGFHDYSTFSRAFKELFRMTPKSYRNLIFSRR